MDSTFCFRLFAKGRKCRDVCVPYPLQSLDGAVTIGYVIYRRHLRVERNDDVNERNTR